MGLFYKIYAGVAGILLGVIIILVLTAGQQEEKIISKSLDNNQLTLSLSVSSQIQTGFYERIWPFELLHELSKNENFLFWYIIDGERSIALSSKPVEEVAQEELEYFNNIDISEKENRKFLVPNSKIWLIPLEIKNSLDEKNWLFCLGYSTKTIRAIFWKNFLVYIFITIALIILTMPVTSWFIRQVLNPLKYLANSSTKISKGLFDEQLPSSSTTEINQLIIAYRSMLDGLKQKDNKINDQFKQINEAYIKLEELNRSLEEKVEERTKKLHANNEKLKRLSNRLSIEKDKAEAANRSISAFMANMSHELRTPLNAILGFSDLLYRNEKDPKNARMLTNISTAGSTLLSLINDILDLSKINARQVKINNEPVDLEKILNEVKGMFSGNAKLKNIDFKILHSKEIIWDIDTDPVRLKQILINLIGNAFKFTEQGSITVDVNCLVNEKKSAINLEFDISDTGIGIPEDQQKKIFEAFVQKEGQSTKKYGGTGLGLAISLKLAKLMGGNLTIKSSIPGKGSIFTFQLFDVPLIERQKAKIINKKISKKIKFSKETTIIYIDDIEDNRTLFKEILHNNFINFNLIECDDGHKGLKAATDKSPDIVFLDLKMPPPTGSDITRQLKKEKKSKNIPVVALTASTDKENHKEFLNEGGNEILLKPLNTKELINVLSHYFHEIK